MDSKGSDIEDSDSNNMDSVCAAKLDEISGSSNDNKEFLGLTEDVRKCTGGPVDNSFASQNSSTKTSRSREESSSASVDQIPLSKSDTSSKLKCELIIPRRDKSPIRIKVKLVKRHPGILPYFGVMKKDIFEEEEEAGPSDGLGQSGNSESAPVSKPPRIMKGNVVVKKEIFEEVEAGPSDGLGQKVDSESALEFHTMGRTIDSLASRKSSLKTSRRREDSRSSSSSVDEEVSLLFGPSKIDQNKELNEQVDLGTSQKAKKSQVAKEASPEIGASFLQPQPVSPGHCTDGFRFGQSSKTLPQVASPFSESQPLESLNYFRQTCQDVLEDPYVSDDSIDISDNELSEMKEQVLLQHLQTAQPALRDSRIHSPMLKLDSTPMSDGCLRLRFKTPVPIVIKVDLNSHTVGLKFAAISDEESAPLSVDDVDNQTRDSSTPFRMHSLESTNLFDDISDDDDDSQCALSSLFWGSRLRSPKSWCKIFAEPMSNGSTRLQINTPKPIVHEVDCETGIVTCTIPPIDD